MTPAEIENTDRDLPPTNRTLANLWRAKAWEYYAELVKANKGLRRLRQRIERLARTPDQTATIQREENIRVHTRLAQLRIKSDYDAAEMERLRAENAALRTQLTKKKIQVLSVPLLPESEIERRYKIMTEDSRSKGVTIEEKKP